MAAGVELGTVENFDADVGLGSLRTAEGVEYVFHCTAVSDGSRRIAAGTRVAFSVGPVGLGVWEATVVTPTVG